VSKVNVLDASAVLAYLQQEKGQDRVEAALDAEPCWLSTVNMCEVLGKLQERDMPPQEAQAAIDDLGLIIVDFDAALALRAAVLRVSTRSLGTSLGDRACLALAEQAAQSKTTPIILTAEQAWTKLKWPFKIVVIR
jgi:PIN domain nuclease of toxin-antitoxin system